MPPSDAVAPPGSPPSLSVPLEAAHLRDTRVGYDAIAEDYAERFRATLDENPWDRAVLDTFAEMAAATGGRVLEAGSGPGRVTAYLHARGVRVRGLDLSQAMVALARREHPEVAYEQGDMTSLAEADGALAGLVAWYSVIHVPPALHPEVFAEFHRVLGEGGLLLLGFQMQSEEGEVLHFDEAFGHAVRLDFHRLSMDRVCEQLAHAGFAVEARTVREPRDNESPVRQGTVLARKRARER
ncbi:class I SAM-dependent DNA methyltransferase [Streptomyces sp. 8L]|uniref:class I SAM-dependent DNA methyltransferase n=1 Tax=Streptomyces sp. 8L TaxID=2877242 RepID=UPI001CD7E3F4|nr:class I SAM-dependent methyltransferase [Streptomyces sp. 8L]MCA1220141.1 class I SAM-dependent methyltransferase [Streptomyces sp. 8L]